MLFASSLWLRHFLHCTGDQYRFTKNKINMYAFVCSIVESICLIVIILFYFRKKMYFPWLLLVNSSFTKWVYYKKCNIDTNLPPNLNHVTYSNHYKQKSFLTNPILIQIPFILETQWYMPAVHQKFLDWPQIWLDPPHSLVLTKKKWYFRGIY